MATAGEGASSGGAATEAPTPRRLAEARRRGELAISAELVVAAGGAAALLVLLWQAPRMLGTLVDFFRASLGRAVSGGGGELAPAVTLRSAVAVAAGVVLPIAVAAAAAALVVGLVQTRGWFAPLGRGDEASGRRPKALSGDAWLAVGRGALKAVAVGVVAWFTVRQGLPGVVGLAGAPAARVIAVGGALAANLAARVVLLLVVFGGLDYLRVVAAHRRALRMTRAEIVRERRQTEGDERMRARRRQQHRALSDQLPPEGQK